MTYPVVKIAASCLLLYVILRVVIAFGDLITAMRAIQ